MSMPSLFFGRSRTWPIDALTTKFLPKNLLMVLALAGDSTMTRDFPILHSLGSGGGEAHDLPDPGSGRDGAVLPDGAKPAAEGGIRRRLGTGKPSFYESRHINSRRGR